MASLGSAGRYPEVRRPLRTSGELSLGALARLGLARAYAGYRAMLRPVLVFKPSSIALTGFNSSTARFGSLACNATAAPIVGSQYFWTVVSRGNVLSSSATSFCASAVSPARAKANAF
jgi:hypothetical protein